MSATKLRGDARQETIDNASDNIESEYSGPRRSFKTQNSSQSGVTQFAWLNYFFEAENFLEIAAEGARETEGELERRRILSRFERNDGLTCDIARLRKLLLRESTSKSCLADGVPHRHAQARSRA
jgi:hypothetical protein